MVHNPSHEYSHNTFTLTSCRKVGGLSPPAERWEAHVRRQDLLPEIEDVRMQMTDHACVSRHSRGKCYGRRDHQSTRQSQRFCCVNGAQRSHEHSHSTCTLTGILAKTPVLKDRPRRQMAFSRPLGLCWEALGRLLESLGRLLGSLGRHFGEPLGPLEASWVVYRRFLGVRSRLA